MERPSKRQSYRLVITLVGCIVAGLIGLAIGYVILRWLRPDANLPEVKLPRF